MIQKLLKGRGFPIRPHVVFILLICGLISRPVPTHAQTQPQNPLSGKNVLILHSHEANAPVFIGTDKGLLTTLESGGVLGINQFFESLDLRRNPGSEYRRLLPEEMRVLYSHRKLDMIITMYPEALEFVLKDCRDIFPHVPILGMYLPQGFEFPKADRRIIGHSARLDAVGTLEIALKLVPRAKRVYVVSGTHEVDRMIENQARGEFKKWEGRLEFRYLSGMPFEDVLVALSTAPPDTIVLLLVFTRDIAGRSYTSPNLTQQLSQVSAAPIFGLLDVALESGMVGGSLINFERIGAKAGELVLDIFRGTRSMENIPGFLDVPPVPMFDWRQLRRWNLRESALPKGSIVLNREFTFWNLKYYIIGVLAFVIAQSFLIAGLLVQKRRKRSAEESLQQKTEEPDQFFNLSLELLCIANTDGYFMRLNPAWERSLGYSREELAHVTRVAMMGELTTSLAHEINQPLTAILSNAEAAQRFLSQASPDISEVRQILEDIIRDDRRANDVVRKVRALVKKEKLRDEPLDLNEVILVVVDLIRADSLLQGLSIATDLSPGLAAIHGDGIQLQQVILNLILNGAAAMRNSPSGQRKIIVRTAMLDSRTVKVFVTDFGTGIDEHHIDRLFEAFYTTKPEGLGMGLSISQTIIKAHGGSMEAWNNREGGGTFAFTLPAHQGDSP